MNPLTRAQRHAVYRIKREYRAERDDLRKIANAEVRKRFAAIRNKKELAIS